MTTPSPSSGAAGSAPPGSGNEPLFGSLPHRTKMVIVWATLVALFVSAVNQTIVSTALPHIVSDLGGFEKFSWVFTAYMLTTTVSSPVWGKLSDRWGRKIFLVIGVCIFIVTSAASGLAQDMNQLIAFRAIQGFGAGMVMSAGFTVIGDLFAPAERARYQGMLAGVFGVASITGPLIGGYLTDTLSWRWAFFSNVPIGLIALPVLFRFLPSARGVRRGAIDVAGVVTLTAAVVPLLLAFVWAGTEYPWGSVQIIGLLAFAAVMTVAFVIAEYKAEDAIIPLELFRNRTYCVVSAVTLLLGLAMFGAIVYVPLFAQGVIGITATGSGLVTAPMMVSMVIASAIAGNIMSRTGRYKALAVVGVATMTVGLFLLSTMGAGTTQLMASFFMIVVGFGIGTGMPIMNTIVQNAAPTRLLGVVTSNMQFYRSIGGTIGVALMGAMVTSQLSANLPTPHPELAALGPEVVATLENPQVLISIEARESLAAVVSQIPAGDAIFASATESLRVALADSVRVAFLISVAFSLLAILAAMILVEHPLRAALPAAPGPDRRQSTASAPAPDARSSEPPPPLSVPAGAISGLARQAATAKLMEHPNLTKTPPVIQGPRRTEMLLAGPRFEVLDASAAAAMHSGNELTMGAGAPASELAARLLQSAETNESLPASAGPVEQAVTPVQVVSERFYAFAATAGAPVTLTLETDAEAEANLAVFGPAGNLVALVNESADGRGQVTLTPRADGRHTAVARHVGSDPATFVLSTNADLYEFNDVAELEPSSNGAGANRRSGSSNGDALVLRLGAGEHATLRVRGLPVVPPIQPAPVKETEPQTDAAKAKEEPKSRVRTFHSLKDPHFALFFLSTLGQMSAVFMQILVRGFLVFQLTGSFTALGFLSLASAIPQLIFGFYGGVLADRFPKKTVTQVGQTVAFAIVFGMGLLAYFDALEFWHLVASGVSSGLLVGMMMPARQAMVHEIVKGQGLMNAISLNTAGMNIMQIAAPAAGGILLKVWGADSAFFVMSGGYAVAIIAMAFVPGAPAAQKGDRSAKAAVLDIVDGIRYIRQHKQLSQILTYSFIVALLGSAYMPVFPGFVAAVFTDNASLLGILIAISAVGSLIGSLILASLPDHHRGHLLLASGIILGVGLLGLSLSPILLIAIAFMIVVGLGQAGRQSVGNTLLQVYSEDAYRGRVMAIFMLQFSMMSLGAFGIGILASATSIQVAFGIVSAALVVVSLFAAFSSKTLREID